MKVVSNGLLFIQNRNLVRKGKFVPKKRSYLETQWAPNKHKAYRFVSNEDTRKTNVVTLQELKSRKAVVVPGLPPAFLVPIRGRCHRLVSRTPRPTFYMKRVPSLEMPLVEAGVKIEVHSRNDRKWKRHNNSPFFRPLVLNFTHHFMACLDQ